MRGQPRNSFTAKNAKVSRRVAKAMRRAPKHGYHADGAVCSCNKNTMTRLLLQGDFIRHEATSANLREPSRTLRVLRGRAVLNLGLVPNLQVQRQRKQHQCR